MKKVISMILIITCVAATNITTIFASSKTSSKAINLSKNTITGDKVNYTLKLQEDWVRYISAEFEKTNNREGIIEKINFYYNPKDSINKPLLLMSFYVFEKSDYVNNNNSNYTKIKSTDDYVFAITYATSNPFTSRNDQANFKRLLFEAQHTQFVASMLSLPSDITGTVIVNNKTLKTKLHTNSEGIYFIPIKEACTALNYTTSWDNKNHAIIIKGKNYSQTFYPNSPSKNSGYSIIIQNDISYINTLYFLWDLQASVEVDENKNNIYITK